MKKGDKVICKRGTDKKIDLFGLHKDCEYIIMSCDPLFVSIQHDVKNPEKFTGLLFHLEEVSDVATQGYLWDYFHRPYRKEKLERILDGDS